MICEEYNEEAGEACFYLGQIYEHGLKGRRILYDKASEYYAKALIRGITASNTRLGVLFLNVNFKPELSNEERENKALSFFRLGVENGDIEAHYEVGKLALRSLNNENLDIGNDEWRQRIEIGAKLLDKACAEKYKDSCEVLSSFLSSSCGMHIRL